MDCLRKVIYYEKRPEALSHGHFQNELSGTLQQIFQHFVSDSNLL